MGALARNVAIAEQRVYLEVLRYIFEWDSGDVFPGSKMCHLHGKSKASEGEYKGRETHIVVEFKPQLLYPPGDEATDDGYDGKNGEGDCGFQCHILLTLPEVDIGRWGGHIGGE